MSFTRKLERNFKLRGARCKCGEQMRFYKKITFKRNLQLCPKFKIYYDVFYCKNCGMIYHKKNGVKNTAGDSDE